MATPIGHALVGLGLHVISARDPSELQSGKRALGLALAATAADVDLLFNLVDGRNHHQGATHSLGLALLVGLVVGLVLRSAGRRRALYAGVVVGVAWFSHGVVDFLSGDTTPPFGPMLLWPFSQAHFLSAWPVFRDTVRALSWHIVRHNALALAQELLILLPLLALALHLRGLRRSDISAWLRVRAHRIAAASRLLSGGRHREMERLGQRAGELDGRDPLG